MQWGCSFLDFVLLCKLKTIMLNNWFKSYVSWAHTSQSRSLDYGRYTQSAVMFNAAFFFMSDIFAFTYSTFEEEWYMYGSLNIATATVKQ